MCTPSELFSNEPKERSPSSEESWMSSMVQKIILYPLQKSDPDTEHLILKDEVTHTFKTYRDPGLRPKLKGAALLFILSKGACIRGNHCFFPCFFFQCKQKSLVGHTKLISDPYDFRETQERFPEKQQFSRFARDIFPFPGFTFWWPLKEERRVNVIHITFL